MKHDIIIPENDRKGTIEMEFKIKKREDTPAFPPNGDTNAVSTLQIEKKEDKTVETQQNAFGETGKGENAVKAAISLDLAKIPPELRAVAAAAAKQAGTKIENEHLLAEKKKDPPQNAMTLDFSDDALKEASGDTEVFKVSKRRDLDVMFDGLAIGPQFQDEIAKQLREEVEKIGKNPIETHFVVYIFLAIAVPNDKEADDGSRWATGPASPKDFQRILPREVRNHFKIRMWWKRNGSRCDAVWYQAIQVESSKQALDAGKRCAELGKMAGAASELILTVPKDSAYVKNILEAYKVE